MCGSTGSSPSASTCAAGPRRTHSSLAPGRSGLSLPQAAVFDDALAGVEAGRTGGFGLVVGVDRVGQAAQLAEHGADIVVANLAELRGRP